jgi:hypothetical protein
VSRQRCPARAARGAHIAATISPAVASARTGRPSASSASRPPSSRSTDGEHADDDAVGGAQRLHRAARRAAGGDHVLDDDDAVAGAVRALDEPPGAVRLGLLAYREGAHRAPGEGARVGHRVRHRVGAERQPADGVGPPPGGVARGETQRADQGEAVGAHCGEPRVDV